jgi:hypothetical protein
MREKNWGDVLGLSAGVAMRCKKIDVGGLDGSGVRCMRDRGI